MTRKLNTIRRYIATRKIPEVLLFYIAWVIAIVLVAIVAYYKINNSMPINSQMHVSNFWNIWNRYDIGWLLEIAQHGYKQLIATAFFPLWPLLLFVTYKIFPFVSILIIAHILATIAFGLAIVIFYKLLRMDFGGTIAKQSAILLIVFPTAFFIICGYSEAIFLLWALLTIYWAKKDQWLLANIAAMLCCVSRLVGILIFIPLIIEYYIQYKKSIKWNILYLLIAPVGLIGYCLYTYYLFGDFFAFVHAEQEWSRSIISYYLFKEIWHDIKGIFIGFRPEENGEFAAATMRLISYLLPLVSTIYLLIKKYYVYGIYLLISFLVPIATGVSTSYFRFLAVMFPMFIVLGIWSKNKFVYYLLFAISVTFQVLFIIMFVNGYWVA